MSSQDSKSKPLGKNCPKLKMRPVVSLSRLPIPTKNRSPETTRRNKNRPKSSPQQGPSKSRAQKVSKIPTVSRPRGRPRSTFNPDTSVLKRKRVKAPEAAFGDGGSRNRSRITKRKINYVEIDFDASSTSSDNDYPDPEPKQNYRKSTKNDHAKDRERRQEKAKRNPARVSLGPQNRSQLRGHRDRRESGTSSSAGSGTGSQPSPHRSTPPSLIDTQNDGPLGNDQPASDENEAYRLSGLSTEPLPEMPVSPVQNMVALPNRLVINIPRSVAVALEGGNNDNPGVRIFNEARDLLTNEDSQLPLFPVVFEGGVHVAIARPGEYVFIPGVLTWIVRKILEGEVSIRCPNDVLPATGAMPTEP